MKKKFLFLLTMASLVILSACGNLGNTASSPNETKKSSSSFQTTGQSSDNDYNGVIIDGKYRTSKSRGVGISQNADNLLNLKSFQTGMLNISKSEFSPKQYIFQEGQYITKEDASKWLDRKSSKNPDGLNPRDNGSKEPNKRNPMYVQQIEEQDFVKEANGKLNLAAMTVGIGMNRKDYYQKEEYGATYSSSISRETMIKEGKIAAQKVLERVRKIDGVGNNIPILICMYEQAENDSLTGGVVYAYTLVKEGTEISDWTLTNLNNLVFPVTSQESVPNDNDANSFKSFKNNIQNFFPNLSGVTAQVQYRNKEMQGMHVNITTQFYSETEISSFTQYVAKAAKTYLPSGIPVDITIRGSDRNIQSFLSRASDSNSYYIHDFESY